MAQRLARGLGTHNIDHRLRQRDFRDQTADPVFPGLGMPVADVDGLEALFVIGSAVIGQNVLGMILALLMRSGGRVVGAVVSTFVVGAWVLPEIVAAFASVFVLLMVAAILRIVDIRKEL